MNPTVAPPAVIVRLRRSGIAYPYWTWREAKIQRLGLPLACAMLTMESHGGAMIFGHDRDALGPCPGYGWGTVTKARYAAFKTARDATGRSNGVGACQLTSPGLQDDADALGGCWKVRPNLAVGFKYLHDKIQEHGLEIGVASYNGSGPAADHYAQEVLAIAAWFKARHCGNVIGIY